MHTAAAACITAASCVVPLVPRTSPSFDAQVQEMLREEGTLGCFEELASYQSRMGLAG